MTMIKQYLRTSNNVPIGVMVADLHDNKLCFGWSVCHGNDRYSKSKGDMIAVNRLNDDDGNKDLVVPGIMFDAMESFMLRAQKHFMTSTEKYLVDGFMLSVYERHAEAYDDLFDDLLESEKFEFDDGCCGQCNCGCSCQDDVEVDEETPNDITSFGMPF